MTTRLYLVRHAEPNYHNHNDKEHELTQKGLQDCQLVLQYFSQQKIHAIYSSPYKRAVETIKSTASYQQLAITEIEDFRERKIDSAWIEDFQSFTQKQWNDFSYKLSDGESLKEVQDRNIDALKTVLKAQNGKNVIISSHGTAISTIINYFCPQFGLSDFQKIKSLFPFIVSLTFEDETCL